MKFLIIRWLKTHCGFLTRATLSFWSFCWIYARNFEAMKCKINSQKVFSLGLSFLWCQSWKIIFLAMQQVPGSQNGQVDFSFLAVVYFGRKSAWQVSECEAPLCFCRFLCLFVFWGFRVCATVQVFGKVVAWQQWWLWSGPNIFMKRVELSKVPSPRTQDRFVVRREKKNPSEDSFFFLWATS